LRRVGRGVIDLRPATLTGAEAGGYLSRVGTTLGGFTIAKDVVIKNATSGSGTDLLRGNSGGNILAGGAAFDSLFGNKDKDAYVIDGRAGTVWGIQVLGSAVDHGFKSGKGRDVITTTLNGRDDFILTNSGNDTVES
jgi:hypothetical protein